MRFVDEFRDRDLATMIAARIKKLNSSPVSIMEVCGTHTVAIYKQGIRGMLPKNVMLISGPGCPVCVTSQADIDKAIELARRRDVIITTFGDMLKVPGSFSSLEKEKANGADIRVVYSPGEALNIAKANPKRKVVFISIGFETTSPLIAATLIDAKKEQVSNFFIVCMHKLIPPVMEALLKEGEVRIDGFICPGHVSTIIGSNAYRSISKLYGIPCVISGFEPLDILQSIYMLLVQIKERRADVEVEYFRAVRPQGNRLAQELLFRVFDVAPAEWRGLGVIPGSGLRLRREFAHFDAERKFQLEVGESRENPACSCGEILRGTKNPTECKLYGRVCTPETPSGPCMVSSEGTCAAFYKYSRDNLLGA